MRLIVPYFPGGTPDIQGRMIAEKLRTRFGQPVVVDNRPGANGSIGMGLAAKAPADGYTWVIAPVGPWAVNPHMYKLGYDTTNDIVPLIHVASTPGVLLLHPSLPAKNVKELIALARKRPGELNYSSAGVGGYGHMCGALFASLAKVNIVHIPHKSQAAAVNDLIGGHLHLLFNVASPVIGHVKSGRLRGLATTAAKRMEVLPDLPTMGEAGVPGYENTTWTGMGVPGNTPRATVEFLNHEIKAVLQLPDMIAALREQGATVTATSPQEFAEYLKAELAKFARLIKETGIRAEGGG